MLGKRRSFQEETPKSKKYCNKQDQELVSNQFLVDREGNDFTINLNDDDTFTIEFNDDIKSFVELLEESMHEEQEEPNNFISIQPKDKISSREIPNDSTFGVNVDSSGFCYPKMDENGPVDFPNTANQTTFFNPVELLESLNSSIDDLLESLNSIINVNALFFPFGIPELVNLEDPIPRQIYQQANCLAILRTCMKKCLKGKYDILSSMVPKVRNSRMIQMFLTFGVSSFSVKVDNTKSLELSKTETSKNNDCDYLHFNVKENGATTFYLLIEEFDVAARTTLTFEICFRGEAFKCSLDLEICGHNYESRHLLPCLQYLKILDERKGECSLEELKKC